MTTGIEHGDPVRYWELAVSASGVLLPMESRFLIPVYRRTFTLEEPDEEE